MTNTKTTVLLIEICHYVLLMLLVLLLISNFTPQESHASSSDNLSGYAWSSNIGWISFNCTNDSSCGFSNYGVTVDSTTGNMSGYAWSSNIGWISFNESSGCPESGCSTQPKVDLTTGVVSGWARALSYGGGWDGWIKLGGSWTPSATFTASNASGYSWGSTVVGWVDWSGVLASIAIPQIPVVNEPDLVPSNLAVVPLASTVGSALVSANADNIGSNGTGVGFSNEFFYQWNSTSGAWQSFAPQANFAKGALGAGMSASTDSYAVSVATTGDLYIKYCVDTTNAIDEGSNDGDPSNCSISSPIRVIAGNITVSDTDINLGDLITIDWNSQNTVGLNCNTTFDGNTWLGTSGTQTVVPTGSGLATFSCSSPTSGPVLVHSVSVNVNTSISLNASPRIVEQGDPTTLSWTVYEAGCTLSGGPLISQGVTGTGSVSPTLTAKTTFTLSCPTSGTRTVTVDVIPKAFET